LLRLAYVIRALAWLKPSTINYPKLVS
jgi:hypothetical protein